VNDPEAIKYVLQKGMDPNFEKGYPLRSAIRVQNFESIKVLIEGGARVNERRYLVVKQCVEIGNFELLKFLLDNLQKSDTNFQKVDFRNELITEWKKWNISSLQTKEDLKSEVEAVLSQYE
jgi:hypothetical protein